MFSSKSISRAGIIASLYIVLSLFTFPVLSGAVQFRIGEGLTLLAVVFPESVVALFIGCFIVNLISGCAIIDCVFGAFITLISAFFSYFFTKNINKKYLKIIVGGIFPVFLNAFLLPVLWYFCYGKLEYLYIVQVLILIVSQTLSVYAIGYPLIILIDKLKNKGVKFLQK